MSIIKKKTVIDGSNKLPILIDSTALDHSKGGRVIVFSHGFKGFKDWGPFNKIAEEFAINDFVFVKFNFSHNGTTIDNPYDFDNLSAFGNNNFCRELDDLNLVIDWLCRTYDPKEIIAFGHSRGGGISMLKVNEDNRINKLVTWASPSDFISRVLKENKEIWKKKGVAYIYNGRIKKNMPMYYQFYENCLDNQNRLSIKNSVRNIKIPQLIIHGDHDPTVDVCEAESLNKWNPSSHLHIIKGADHVFGGFHPYNLHSFPPGLDEAISETIDFLKR
tara:strand:+ start:95 stop:919 length:825 start_codon:yes stop_codon:yes gene_type:complete